MKLPILQALFLDAWQQVLDNRVFRLLLVVALLLVAPTFLVGFHSTHVEFLWGLGSINYSDLLNLFPGGERGVAGRVEEPGVALIQLLQDLVVTSFAGTMGIVLAIAATSFFVPRMLERGAADMLFSKPIPRWALLLSRYASGLIFVATLSLLLVLGMYLGFRVTSGYNDPGFLWSALTLVYLYAALHAFSLMVATLTRSSVAALLLTIVLFSFSGCVHSGWIAKEQFHHDESLAVARSAMEDASRRAALAPEDVVEGEEEPAPELPSARESSKVLERLILVLDVLHYTLPKTSDADLLVRKLKQSFNRPMLLEDPAAKLVIRDSVWGWRMTTPGKLDLSRQAAVWVPADAGAGETSPHSLRLSRSERRTVENGRTRTLTVLSASSQLMDSLKAAGTAREVARKPLRLAGTQAYIVSWEEGDEAEALRRERWLFGYKDALFELDATLPGQDDGASEYWRVTLQNHLILGEDAEQQRVPWYERQFTLDAPLRYNPLFSIGSTLAFALISLLLAVWRLRRIDF
jgi:ABC-type transport system involved in multi-copper enzyme maturation permease subunit